MNWDKWLRHTTPWYTSTDMSTCAEDVFLDLFNVLQPSFCTILAKLVWWGSWQILIYCMFYDHLSAHSLLAKLGWWWLRRLAWMKSQKTLDTSKRLHQNKTRSTGSVGKWLYPNFAIIGTTDSGKCRYITHEGGGGNILARWRLQPAL